MEGVMEDEISDSELVLADTNCLKVMSSKPEVNATTDSISFSDLNMLNDSPLSVQSAENTELTLTQPSCNEMDCQQLHVGLSPTLNNETANTLPSDIMESDLFKHNTNICEDKKLINLDQNIKRNAPEGSSAAQGYDVSASGRRLRKVRRFVPPQDSGLKCPACGLSLQTTDLRAHLTVELQRLKKYQKYVRRSVENPKPCTSQQPEVEEDASQIDENDTPRLSASERQQTYLRIRRKRLQRKECKDSSEGTQCPVCNQWITGSQDKLTRHVEQCLGQGSDPEEEDVDIDGEDEEEYEEYTWAGQTRIRATTMLPGGFTGSGFQAGDKCDDDDVDLDIEDDETNTYGTAQFSEVDLIPCTSEEPGEEKERQALREAVLRSSGECSSSGSNTAAERLRWSECDNDENTDHKKSHSLESTSTIQAAKVISTLKAKLSAQEELLKKLDKLKCLICLETYTQPLVSIQCWHVHCEECWLRTLGAKKLCPQCNMITSAADLRKIYL